MDTTIKIKIETKVKLLDLKQYPRETYDDVLKRLIEEKEVKNGRKS